MVIGLDARMLGSGFGLARYTKELVKHLLQIDNENQYILFLRQENYEEISLTEYGGWHKKVLADIPWYSYAEQVKFTSLIKKEKVDLMHFPHWNVPIFYNDPFVVTIHDLIMFHYPRPEASTLSPISYWIKDKAMRFVLRNAVKKAKRILVTSEFTKNDVHKNLGVPMEKMTVTYQAPYSNQKSKIKSQKSVLDKYDLSQPFILYVGAAYPHKNLVGLLKVWKIFTDKHGLEYQLVLVGLKNYFYEKLEQSELFKSSQNAKYIGFVPDTELTELYKAAKLYVFPSLYEGFGLPPLEAMSHGLPVVSSNRSCLPEVLGEAALYFDPENPAQLADCLYVGLTDESVRQQLKENALTELKRYSWLDLAKKALAEYNKSIKN